MWPTSFPRLREGLYEYYSHVYPWARQLLRIFALALGLDEDAFEEQHKFPITGMRALHYPPQEPEEDTPGLNAHADFSFFTMVCQEPDSKPALEVLNLNGKWISAPPIPGAVFTCNVGDFLEVASNKIFTSTVHRVYNRSGERRWSLPFFFSPDPDAVIEPLPAFVGKEGPKFPPMLVGQHYVRRVLNSRIHHPSAKFVRKVS
jgi:isopenicillin N synthase-like dioxygenase